MSTGINIVNSYIQLHLKKEERLRAYMRRRRIFWISFAVVFVLAVTLFSLYQFTSIIFGPPEELNSSSTTGDWTMHRRDLARTGSSNPGGILPQSTIKWTFATGGSIHSSAAVANGKIYFGSRDGKLYALDAATGNKAWEFQTDSWVESSPVISDGIVYFGSNDGKLYALNADSGKILWAFKLRFGIVSSPAVADGAVYFGADDFFVYAVDAKNGKELWHFETGNRIMSSPTIANGILYIGSMDGFLYTLHANSGRLQLKFKSYAPIVSSPSVKDSVVYYGTTRGTLYAVNGNSRNWPFEHILVPYWRTLYMYGTLPKPPGPSGFMWSLWLGAPSYHSPVIQGDLLYIGSGDKIFAIDTNNREVLWIFEAGSRLRSSPALVDTTIYACGEDGQLFALDALTGERLWNLSINGKITSSPAVADGTVYVGSHDGRMYAIQ